MLGTVSPSSGGRGPHAALRCLLHDVPSHSRSRVLAMSLCAATSTATACITTQSSAADQLQLQRAFANFCRARLRLQPAACAARACGITVAPGVRQSFQSSAQWASGTVGLTAERCWSSSLWCCTPALGGKSSLSFTPRGAVLPSWSSVRCCSSATTSEAGSKDRAGSVETAISASSESSSSSSTSSSELDSIRSSELQGSFRDGDSQAPDFLRVNPDLPGLPFPTDTVLHWSDGKVAVSCPFYYAYEGKGILSNTTQRKGKADGQLAQHAVIAASPPLLSAAAASTSSPAEAVDAIALFREEVALAQLPAATPGPSRSLNPSSQEALDAFDPSLIIYVEQERPLPAVYLHGSTHFQLYGDTDDPHVNRTPQQRAIYAGSLALCGAVVLLALFFMDMGPRDKPQTETILMPVKRTANEATKTRALVRCFQRSAVARVCSCAVV
jgi:hypothetical protein